jgi:two-component system, cell cycle sensor histidine kinase and response regulator CckA
MSFSVFILSRQKIMIIDDELDITNLFKEILMNAGYQVEGFTDPLKALAECNINHDKYILIISDVKMPKMTGIELVKKIAKIDGNIKVILMTAFDVTGEELKEVKIEKFLNKPVYLKKLIEIVKLSLLD